MILQNCMFPQPFYPNMQTFIHGLIRQISHISQLCEELLEVGDSFEQLAWTRPDEFTTECEDGARILFPEFVKKSIATCCFTTNIKYGCRKFLGFSRPNVIFVGPEGYRPYCGFFSFSFSFSFFSSSSS